MDTETTDAELDAPEPITFDATTLARGWLSVALAASKDKDRPILNRTVHVEVFEHGVRLIATDSYLLLRAWVAQLYSDALEPGLDEAPTARVIASDPYGRGKNLLAYLLNLTRGEDAEAIEIDLIVGDTDRDDANAAPTFSGMEKEWVTFVVPDRERLKLPTIDGEFPDWRPLAAAVEPESTDAVQLSCEMVRRLADLEKTTGKASVRWVFGGAERPAEVSVPGAFPSIAGLVMPQRMEDWGKEPEPEGAAGETTRNDDSWESTVKQAVIDMVGEENVQVDWVPGAPEDTQA